MKKINLEFLSKPFNLEDSIKRATRMMILGSDTLASQVMEFYNNDKVKSLDYFATIIKNMEIAFHSQCNQIEFGIELVSKEIKVDDE